MKIRYSGLRALTNAFKETGNEESMQNGKRTVRAEEKELLGAEDVAGLIGVRGTTVYKWCKEGKLPCLKVVKTAALEEAIDEWPSSMLRRVQAAHSAIILASEGGLSLSRATPMPPS
jgi:predicted DNA-binding transcriptional regulator AlpA